LIEGILRDALFLWVGRETAAEESLWSMLCVGIYAKGLEDWKMEGIAKLISASAWALVALMLAAGIPFAWRKVLAWLDAKSQVAMAEAVRRMIEE
jgi:hypothetical protein